MFKQPFGVGDWFARRGKAQSAFALGRQAGAGLGLVRNI
jgi:hypothetical protein